MTKKYPYILQTVLDKDVSAYILPHTARKVRMLLALRVLGFTLAVVERHTGDIANIYVKQEFGDETLSKFRTAIVRVGTPNQEPLNKLGKRYLRKAVIMYVHDTDIGVYDLKQIPQEVLKDFNDVFGRTLASPMLELTNHVVM